MCKDACVLYKLARIMVQTTNGPCTLADAERLGENLTTFFTVGVVTQCQSNIYLQAGAKKCGRQSGPVLCQMQPTLRRQHAHVRPAHHSPACEERPLELDGVLW